MKQSSHPRGDVVEPAGQGGLPRRTDYVGQFVTLSPVDSEADVNQLFLAHMAPPSESSFGNTWRTVPLRWQRTCNAGSKRGQRPMIRSSSPCTTMNLSGGWGWRAFSTLPRKCGVWELGHIWYAADAQGTQANTEAVYLMLCEAFDRLNYRRVEWKCDALNARSRTAALRLGFSFEAIFKQHMIVKGRNRDTAWFALLDSEWPSIKKNFQRWLYHNPGWKLSLAELNRGRL